MWTNQKLSETVQVAMQRLPEDAGLQDLIEMLETLRADETSCEGGQERVVPVDGLRRRVFPIGSPKEMVYNRLCRLSDQAALEQIRDDVDAMIAIQASREDFRCGRVYSHDQVVEMSKSWITKKNGQLVQ